MATYSHSKLAAFESCPRAYKFAYIERPEVEGFEGWGLAGWILFVGALV